MVDEPGPETQGLSVDETAMVFPSCVVTRAAARRARDSKEVEEPSGSSCRKNCPGDGSTTLPPGDGNCMRNSVDTLESTGSSSLSRAQLIADQKNDSELCQLAENAASVDEAFRYGYVLLQ